MIALDPPFRLATAADAPVLAELVNQAGEGLPLHFWRSSVGPDGDAWAFGRERQAKRAEAGDVVALDEGACCVAAMTGYPVREPSPVDEVSEMFRPLQALENEAVGTWYLNILATLPAFRGRGYGNRLAGLAERIAREEGLGGVSLIVADRNEGARRLYERLGYREIGRRAIVKDGWVSSSTEWILLLKATT